MVTPTAMIALLSSSACVVFESSDQTPLAAGGAVAGGGGPAGSGQSAPDEGRQARASGGAGADSGSDEGDSGAPEGMRSEAPVRSTAPLSEVPQVLAASRCVALDRCLGGLAMEALLGQEDCVERFTEELLATAFDGVEAAIEAGRLLYDPAGLEQCLGAIEALACDVLSHGLPVECAWVLRGNVPLGGECGGDLECHGAAFCQTGEDCVARCVERLPQGAECQQDRQCGDALLCQAGVCRPPAPEGAECGGESGIECALELACVAEAPGASEVCMAFQARAGLGEACLPLGTGCADGLACLADGQGGFACAEPVAEPGAACRLGLPGECALGEYCELGEAPFQGTCRPLPDAGEPCAGLGLCAAGHACIAQPDGETLCQPILANGQACLADAMCRSQRCVDLICVPPTACS